MIPSPTVKIFLFSICSLVTIFSIINDLLALEEIISEEGDGEEDEVVRTKSITLKPITLDEAILEMEAINHDFYMYLDTDDEQISVVYRRKEGGYGLIQATNKVDLK